MRKLWNNLCSNLSLKKYFRKSYFLFQEAFVQANESVIPFCSETNTFINLITGKLSNVGELIESLILIYMTIES